MSFTLTMIAVLTFVTPGGNEVDRRQLLQLVDAAQRTNYQDVEFDYEGRWARPREPALEEVYTGSFRHRADGAMLLDVYHFPQQPKPASHGMVAILDGTTSSSTQNDRDPKAKVSVKKQGPLEFAGPGNYRMIWLVDLFRKYVDSIYKFEYGGTQSLDGAECIMVRFRLIKADDTTTPPDRTMSELFWIDLNRGGHVVQYERRVEGENLSERTIVQLKRYEPRPGRATWLPVSGRVESFVSLTKDRKRGFETKPTKWHTYMLLESRLQIDQGLEDDAFTIQARPGDDVSDAVRKARYEFGQYLLRPKLEGRQPTDAEQRAELDRMLKDSKVMANELKASSPALEGSGWWTYGPWALAGVALAALGVVGYRRRGG